MFKLDGINESVASALRDSGIGNWGSELLSCASGLERRQRAGGDGVPYWGRHRRGARCTDLGWVGGG